MRMALGKNKMTSNLPLIFYADDDAAFLHLFQLGLGEDGPSYQIKCFSDGDSLLQTMTNLHAQFELLPHIVLLDLNMPVKDGLSTLRELKRNPAFQGIPVFIISDSDRQEIRDLVCEMGAEAFIEKPMAFSGIQDVLQKIHMHLNSSEKTLD